MNLSYTIGKQSLSLFINGRQYSVNRNATNFPEIAKALKALKPENKPAFAAGLKKLHMLVDPTIGIEKKFKGKVLYKNGAFFYDGVKVNNYVATRIDEIAREGFNTKPLQKFLENVLQNPEKRSQEELYKFLEKGNLPITEDGYFLAYKAVRNDFKDNHSATMDNSPGKVVKMDRKKVDNNAGQSCGTGLHVGTAAFVKGFKNDYVSNGRIVLTKCHPKDAVCVPHEDAGKIRVCEYLVLGEIVDGKLIEFNEGKALTKAIAKKKEIKSVAKNTTGPKRDANGRFVKKT